MLFAWAMTLLTRDTEYVVSSPVAISQVRIRNRFKERCMTFEASGHDRSAEIYRPVSISRTVNPTPHFGPIGNGKLKELIFFVPVKISLSLAPGADDEVEAFGNGDRVGRSSEYARLEKAILFRFHPVVQFALGSSEDVFAGSKTAGNRFRCCWL